MHRNAMESTPEEAVIRILGTSGFALGLLLTISALVM